MDAGAAPTRQTLVEDAELAVTLLHEADYEKDNLSALIALVDKVGADAKSLAGARPQMGHNDFQTFVDGTMPLEITLASIAQKRFDRVPRNRLHKEIANFSSALDDLKKARG